MAVIPTEWSSDTFRAALLALVRRRVPERDAEDVVQVVLSEAVASPHRPDDPETARKWIYGIVRNKVASYHRRARFEQVDEQPEPPASATAEQEQSLLRWAMKELPAGLDAQRTLEWLLRESEGEKLEDIAESEQLSAPQVRQRVSRLRKHFRDRWAMHVAALAALGALGFVAWIIVRKPSQRAVVGPVVNPEPDLVARVEKGKQLRRDAMKLCEERAWAACLEGLNTSRELDPEGDRAPEVQAARVLAQRALEAPPPSLPKPNTTRDAQVEPVVSAPDSDRDAGEVTSSGTADVTVPPVSDASARVNASELVPTSVFQLDTSSSSAPRRDRRRTNSNRAPSFGSAGSGP
jgi:RNA polymerase sigma factor (sigma-70 family)